eukprot:ctg_1897.g543
MWSFGAWSGVNECGVAVATDWVRTREAAPPRQSDSAALLAPDLVRLALERAKSARRAAELVIRLVEQHGLGHDARISAAVACGARFVMADAAEAWLLEAACGFWALRPLRDGVFCWGNALSIGAADFLADGAVEHARQRGWYDAQRDGRFCFARAFGPAEASADQSAPDAGRLPCGHAIPAGAHTLATMLHDVLRHACSDHAKATCLDAAAAPGGMPGLAQPTVPFTDATTGAATRPDRPPQLPSAGAAQSACRTATRLLHPGHVARTPALSRADRHREGAHAVRAAAVVPQARTRDAPSRHQRRHAARRQETAQSGDQNALPGAAAHGRVGAPFRQVRSGHAGELVRKGAHARGIRIRAVRAGVRARHVSLASHSRRATDADARRAPVHAAGRPSAGATRRPGSPRLSLFG